jgi:hypothetical protein
MILWDADGGPRAEIEAEWKGRMRASYADPSMKKFTLSRVSALVNGSPLDWDDNIPEGWAVDLLAEWAEWVYDPSTGERR